MSRRPPPVPWANLRALAIGVVLAGSACAVGVSAVAKADPVSSFAGDFETPFGQARGEEHRSFDPDSRDARGNRVVINGRMLLGEESSTLPPGLARESGATGLAQAIGNQLNVVVEGSRNTVIVDATQINNGDVEAGVVLNGELDLDD